MKMNICVLPLAMIGALTISQPVIAEVVEWGEFKVIIETNATDGDVGFHALADGDAWRWAGMEDPDGNMIWSTRAQGGLMQQGLTESFFESAEPLCEPDPDEPDEDVADLAEFISRFPEGEYIARANTNEGDRLLGSAELTYNMPAAPDISMTEDTEQYIHEVVIEWAPGTDLGDKCHDQSLIDDGTVADPADVEVVGWEVVVEPDDEDAAEPFRVYKVQVPPEQTRVLVPEAYLWMLFDEGFTEFKFEVGAIEESGNQTFSEGSFEVNHEFSFLHDESSHRK